MSCKFSYVPSFMNSTLLNCHNMQIKSLFIIIGMKWSGFLTSVSPGVIDVKLPNSASPKCFSVNWAANSPDSSSITNKQQSNIIQDQSCEIEMRNVKPLFFFTYTRIWESAGQDRWPKRSHFRSNCSVRGSSSTYLWGRQPRKNHHFNLLC